MREEVTLGLQGGNFRAAIPLIAEGCCEGLLRGGSCPVSAL